MTKDKFLNNTYSLLTVAIIILIAGMMYVNMNNTGFTYSGSSQVNPDLPPFEDQTIQKQLFTGFSILAVGTGVLTWLFSYAKKQLPKRYDRGHLRAMNFIYSLYIIALTSIFIFSLIILTFLMLTETF